jgi:hypothetical protein
MKALLMHRDRDFDLTQDLLPRHERALSQDLELDTLLSSMAGGDEFLFDVAYKALRSGLQNDVNTILYRQGILRDCLNNPLVVRQLYNLVVETIESKKKHWYGIFSKYPGMILHDSIELLGMFMGMLKKLRSLAEEHAAGFGSEGFTSLFAMIKKELSDEYFACIHNHLRELRFRRGVLMSAGLSDGNSSTNHVLRMSSNGRWSWLKGMVGVGPPAYTFYLHERDEAGARILSELRDRGINLVANVLAQSADHILSFFEMLRTELGFYVGCLNLRDRLKLMEAPICFPRPEASGTRSHHSNGLYDVCLALTMGRKVVSNTVNADGMNLVLITGANQGGKSTFLRSIGLAQLMMQCGMFVGAESFTGELCTGLFTHYKREEDATMRSGKLDEELSRMSEIADHITPNSMLLCNESFAATNEREGSEIARQIVRALLEKRIKVFFVTHLYEFAHGFFDNKMVGGLFLRAERLADGARTFRLIEGEPMETSFGEDLYREIFPAGIEN